MIRSLLAIVCFLFIGHTTFAQLRLASTSRYYFNSVTGGLAPTDSAAIIYTLNNNHVGGAEAYLAGTLKYNECYVYNWDFQAGYYLTQKTTYEYDAIWNVSKKITQKPNAQMQGALSNFTEEHYQYNAQGNEIVKLTIKWNNNSSQWDSSIRYNSAYDANGNLTSVLTETWPNSINTAQVTRRNIYTYDNNNNLTSMTEEWWNLNTTSFDSIYHFTYTYTPNNNLSITLAEDYDRVNNVWYNKCKDSFGYTNNLLTLEQRQRWSPGTNAILWVSDYKYDHIYNAQNERIRTNYYKGLSISGWQKMSRDSFTTVSTNPKIQHTISFAGDNSIPSQRAIKRYNSDNYIELYTTQGWNNNTNLWQTGDSTIYRYEDISGVSANNINANAPQVSLYPNPASSFINIAVTQTNKTPYTIAIYSIEGRLVMQQYVADGAATKSIPTAHLSNGQYILSITNPEGKNTQQFSVLR